MVAKIHVYAEKVVKSAVDGVSTGGNYYSQPIEPQTSTVFRYEINDEQRGNSFNARDSLGQLAISLSANYSREYAGKSNSVEFTMSPKDTSPKRNGDQVITPRALTPKESDDFLDSFRAANKAASKVKPSVPGGGRGA